MILKVGLTGGTASGKSTVAQLLAELGCLVIDADAVVHEMYRPGQPGYEAVLQRFGRAVLMPDGTIDRARLAEMAFASAETTAELNALIHPLVIAREQEMLAAEERSGNDRIVVVEATLLLESGGRERYDRIVVVEAPRESQIQRAVARGLKREDAERRISRQMSPEQRRSLVDYVIRNDGTRAELAAKTRALYQQFLRDLDEEKKSQ